MVLLLETGRVNTCISEDLNVERARKVAALIADRSWSKDDQILDRSPDDLHAGQPSEIEKNLREPASRTLLGNAVA